MRKKISDLAWRPFAAVYLVLSWFWDKAGAIVAKFFEILPIQPIKDAIARFFDRIPAWLALMTFLIPFAVLEPLHLTVFYFLAKKQFLFAALDSITLRLVQLGLVAFLFDQGRDKFLQVAWFKRLYVQLIYWKHRARELLHPHLLRIKGDFARLRNLVRRGNFPRH